MSDQPRSRTPDPDRTSSDQQGTDRSDSRPFDHVAPLRTRRDPVTGTDGRIRPPSGTPSWSEPTPSRRRGTGRYAAPVESLPPAEIPAGMPDWMGRPEGTRPGRAPVRPRPLGGSVRRAEDYGATAHDTRPQPAPRPRPTSWPEQRPARSVDLDPEPVDNGPEPARVRERPGSERPGRGRRTRRTTGRRTGLAFIEDPLCQQLGAVLILAVLLLWGVTWLQRDAVESPLTLRLDADGVPSLLGDATTIWRLPFVATMLGLMSLGAAVILAGRQPFAARFLSGMGIGVQALVWVAASTLLW